MKFAVLADIHAFNSTVYSGTGHDGVNTRLRIILNEMRRAASVLKAEGGDTMIIAGDIFHTRGSIDPEVLNPLRETVESILMDDIDIYAIPGNHDLKSKDSKALSSQIENLAQISISGGQFQVFNAATTVSMDGTFSFGFVPWRNNKEELLDDLKALKALRGNTDIDKMHVFIHAGIDGVLSGMPAHGLTHTELETFGFKRVYAGHYHNHVVFPGGKVVSIGATTHHNRGDAGTRAGFLIVDTVADTVTFHDTLAPKFVDLTGMDEIDMQLECKGNYVHFSGPPMTQADINELRGQFETWGALGVSIEVPKATATARTSAPAKGLTIQQSVSNFVSASKSIPATVDRTEVEKRALERLKQSQMELEEA